MAADILENSNSSIYVDTFITERPRNGIDSPHARLQSALKLNEELAEYFRDRAQIEDVYAKSIAKLTKKNYISNKPALGTFLPLWEMLQIELAQSTTIHSEYSANIIEIEQNLRSCIPANKDYSDITRMNEDYQKIAREYDELDVKIQKHKKNAKGEAKAAEYAKQQEQKLAEWRQYLPQFLQKHQAVDEHRWYTLKSTIELFSSLQQAHANKIIEMTKNTMTATENLQVIDEVAAFCAAYASHQSTVSTELPTTPYTVDQIHESELINVDIVPEPSVSNMSLRQAASPPPPPPPPAPKKEKKRFFSSLVSMRRKPKDSANHVELGSEQPMSGNRQRSFSNTGSFVESSSLHSINTHSTVDHHHDMSKSASNFGTEITSPSSPTSMNPPSLRKAPSFNESVSSTLTPQPAAPLIVVDSEGYSIPPPDRTAWNLESINNTSESLLEVDDMGSDAGSLFGNSRIRVDIKSEATEEDASQSAVALNRVSTLLKEKNSNSATPRRLRGRREMRATQLYSVIEQDQTLPKMEEQPAAIMTSPFANPFELSQEKIVEEEPETNFSEDLPQIDVHISETVHVRSNGGEAEKSAIWGEISLTYKGPTDSVTPICFHVENAHFEKMEVLPFVEQLEGYDQQTFKINSQLFSPEEPTVCIKYQLHLAKDRLPLIVKPIWKCDADKSRLLVKYHKHSDLPTLENVIFVTTVTGNVQNALSIPAGELILSQNRIKWNIGQIASDEEAFIKAQFTTLEQGTTQPIAIRFEMKDHLFSNVKVDTGSDKLVIWAKIRHTSRSVKVGKYIVDA